MTLAHHGLLSPYFYNVWRCDAWAFACGEGRLHAGSNKDTRYLEILVGPIFFLTLTLIFQRLNDQHLPNDTLDFFIQDVFWKIRLSAFLLLSISLTKGCQLHQSLTWGQNRTMISVSAADLCEGCHLLYGLWSCYRMCKSLFRGGRPNGRASAALPPRRLTVVKNTAQLTQLGNVGCTPCWAAANNGDSDNSASTYELLLMSD